jgi:hypothetical protein
MEEIVGEIPFDDLALIEEEYRAKLLQCFFDRGINISLIKEKTFRLIPNNKQRIYHVAIFK